MPKQDTGDWNSKVENRAESNITGKFGLWVRNEAEEWLENFWGARKHVHLNPMYTWTVYVNLTRWPIQKLKFEIRSTRWRNCVTDHELSISSSKADEGC